jgi:hypothetical protein
VSCLAVVTLFLNAACSVKTVEEPNGGAGATQAGQASSAGTAGVPAATGGNAGGGAGGTGSSAGVAGTAGAASTAGGGAGGGAGGVAHGGAGAGGAEPIPADGSWMYEGCDDVEYPDIDSNNGQFPPGSCPPPAALAAKCPGDSKLTVTSAKASSFETAFPHPPEYAIDEHLTTRWSSNVGPSATLTLDLGVKKPFKRLYLLWELAHGEDYDIEVSDDESTWSTLVMKRGGDGFQDIHQVSGDARYVRLKGIKRGSTGDVPQCCAAPGTLHGYSLFDFTLCAEG